MTAPRTTDPQRAGPLTDHSADGLATIAGLGRELKLWLRRGPRRGLKVGALAKRLGVSQSTLYAYLAGTTLPPTEVLDDLLHAIAVPPEEHRRLATARDALDRKRRTGGRPDDRGVVTPRELPSDPRGFVGRTDVLDELDAALRDGLAAGPSAAVLSGPAGVGKTASALRWAHRVADQFPDGCLYVDLLGFAPGEPRQPPAVLSAFLRSLGVADTDIPQDTHERENRLRTMLAGRRVLFVLDNALDAAQVRPLLPAESLCFAVVTSRNHLGGLCVRPGAAQIPVAPLPTGVAIELLQSHLPRRMAATSSEAPHTLADRCGGLPLALRVVGAYASSRPDHSLDDLVDELGGGLDAFDVGDSATSVRAVFSWSESRLLPPVATTFYLLGLSPVPALDGAAAAALCGTDEQTVARYTDELVRAHLVQQSSSGKLSMHDLVREYAREQAERRLSVTERRAAHDRVLEHLSMVAAQAVTLLHPWDDDPAPDEHPSVFGSRREAQRWVEDEWDTLMSAVRFCTDTDRPEQTIALVTALRRHLEQGGRYLAALAVLGAGRDAARRTGDRVTEATVTRDLGAACLRLGRHEDATEHYGEVLALTREIGDRAGEAGTLNNLGNVHERLGAYDEALDHYHRALPIARELRLGGGEATLLLNLGATYSRLGDVRAALEHSRRALAIFDRIGDNGGAARALGNIGDILRSTGAYDEALDHLSAGLGLAREIGAASIETEILNALGATHLAIGSPDDARKCHEAAVDAAREMGDRFEEARALDGLARVLDAEGDPAGADTARSDATAIYRALGLPRAV